MRTNLITARIAEHWLSELLDVFAGSAHVNVRVRAASKRIATPGGLHDSGRLWERLVLQHRTQQTGDLLAQHRLVQFFGVLSLLAAQPGQQ